jgi:hypothetical protein
LFLSKYQTKESLIEFSDRAGPGSGRIRILTCSLNAIKGEYCWMRSVFPLLILAVCALGLASTVNAEETDPDLVNDTLQNLTTASLHFQAGIQQITGDVNLSNASTDLANARSVVEEFIQAYNALIHIVNRILELVAEFQPVPGNLPET